VDKHKALHGEQDQAAYLIMAKDQSAQKKQKRTLFDPKEPEITESTSWEEEKPIY